MARLEYTITGDITGLASAADGVKGILNNLQLQADKLNIKLFSAETEADINAIGGALTIVTGKINEYTTSAIQGSQAFKDQSAQAALDALATKIAVLTGSAQLFGDSIKNQQAQITAYQQAINKILAQGFDPLDSRITSLKDNIDSLTSSIEAQKEAAKAYIDPFAKFAITGSLIKDAENKVRNLSAALRDATSTRDIALYNVRLTEAQKQLNTLKNTGVDAATAASRAIDGLGRTGTRLAGSFNQVGIEFGRVIQDLPYAANNFGAVGNNITRIVEVLPGYINETRAVIIANGGVATSANVARTALAGLFTGFGGISLAISALVTGFVIYQQHAQSVKKETKETTDSIEKLREAIKSIDESQISGALSGANDSAKLQQLYSASQDILIPLKERVKIVDELQKQFPQTFQNFSDEAILAGKASDAYERLNKQLIGKAILQANTENLANALKPLLLQQQVAIENQRKVQEAQKILSDPLKAGTKGIQEALKTIKDAKLEDLFKPINEKTAKDAKQIIADILSAGNKLIEEFGANILVDPEKADKSNSGLNKQINLLEQLQAILNKSQKSADNSGLEGYALIIQKINNFYKDLNVQLDNFNNKVKEQRQLNIATKGKKGITENEAVNLLNLSDQGRATFEFNQTKEINDARIGEVERVNNEIQRINNDFGVKAETGRNKELAQIEARYDAEVVKAKKNILILDALEKDRLIAIQAVNDKYTLIVSDTYEKIQNIADQADSVIGNSEANRIAKTVLQYNKLQQTANKYYDNLKLLQAQGQPDLQGVNINAQQQDTNSRLNRAETRQVSIILSATFSQALQSSITAFGNNFYKTIIDLGKTRQDIDTKYAIQLDNATDQNTKDQINKLKELEQATTTSFGAIFSSLVAQFNQTFSQSIIQSFVKKITDGFGEVLITPSLKDLGKTDPATNIISAAGTFSNTVVGAGQAFAAAVNGLAPAISSASTDIVDAGQINKQAITSGGEDAGTGLSKGGAALAAAATVVGSVISGVSSPTSSVGQGLGGAISGAGEGALIGSALAPVTGGASIVLGAAIGGLVGLVGGLFSASKARKQREEQQLAEAKRQTELLKQQVAYTSSIVGRNTANGVITGVEVGAFGQLVATVSGKDLQFVLDRTKKSR